MPIEINEVVIRAVVDPKNSKRRITQRISSEEKEEIVEECVEQVIRILEKKEER